MSLKISQARVAEEETKREKEGYWVQETKGTQRSLIKEKRKNWHTLSKTS
jgi:hypothetical protein